MKNRAVLFSLLAMLIATSAAPAWAHSEQGKISPVVPHSEQGRVGK